MARITRRSVWIATGAAVVLLGLALGANVLRNGPALVPLLGSFLPARHAMDAVAEADKVAYWTCTMHPHVSAEGPGTCPECGMDLVPLTHAGGEAREAQEDTGATVALAGNTAIARAGITIDPRRQQLIGVRTVPVERRSLTTTVRAVGLVRYDETRLADVNLKVEGWIRDLYVDYTGVFVKAGQPLFTLYSPELLTTQNEYLLALETRDLLRGSQVGDAREHADRLVESARQRLALWDLPPDQLARLHESRQPQAASVFRSPVTGYVIEKRVVKGQHVRPGQSLYSVADLSTVWVEADVYEQEAPRVRAGARAAVTLDAYPGERFDGRVTFVYPFVSEQSRTLKVRLAFGNRGLRLKPGMYANVELSSPSGNRLVVPTEALLDSGQDQVVFVAHGGGYFEPRTVRAGERFGGSVEILEGLEEGESVATGAAFFLDSESQLRSSLQAYEAPPPDSRPSEPRDRVSIAFRSQPDPPRQGENQLEAIVMTPDGQPVTDAQVRVVFFMAAMPSMNMPAMRSQTALTHAGNGVYRGIGRITTPGRWDATVLVERGGQRIGTRQLSVVAK